MVAEFYSITFTASYNKFIINVPTIEVTLTVSTPINIRCFSTNGTDDFVIFVKTVDLVVK